MIQKKVTDFFALEGNYPDLDGEGAAARLSAAIRCKTINYFDHSRTDYTEFDKLHAHIKASYPNIMRVGTFERIGHHAVLITIPGSDASLRPCLYMSHQDVVPVVEGTEQDWTHPAFSGDIADGYIWGRGTLDIKEQVFGVLEAAEYLLARGKSFARTAYLAFGDDEETINLGALAIAEHLKAQGVTLEFVLDEGGCKIEPGTAFGAPETAIVSVQLMEKGYADLELSVHSIGGHSSRPFGGTSLARLSGVIADIPRAPFAVRLNSAMTGAFETLAPYITQEPLKTLVQDVAGNADAIVACCMGSPDLFPFVTTTIAPTMIRGGSADNILSDFLPHLVVHGGWVVDENNNPTVDTPEFKAAMQEYLDLYALGSTLDKDDIVASVTSGETALAQIWPGWYTPTADGPANYTTIPTKLTDDSAPVDAVALQGVWCIGIPDNAPHKDLALELLEYVMSPEVQLASIENNGVPCRYSCLTDSTVLETYPHLQTVCGALETGVYRPVIEEWTEFTNILGTEMDNIIQGTKTMDEALAYAQEQLEQLMA